MSWLELKLQTSAEDADFLDELLWAAGAVSVTLTDAGNKPLFEPPPGETPLWDALVLTALFDHNLATADIEAALASGWSPRTLPPLHFDVVPDQDWVRNWLDDFRPMRFGQRLWVCPSWYGRQEPAVAGTWTPSPEDIRHWCERNRELLEQSRVPGQKVMLLDPGLAFGTGTHPTTALCLDWLDRQSLAAARVIDYGCGSGILGLAALLLGAEQVLGVDTDPQALTATRDNCMKNQVSAELFPVCLPAEFRRLSHAADFRPADGVMANILAGTLVALAPELSALVRTEGWLLLSGILEDQARSVIDAYAPWFTDFSQQQQGDWVRISARRLPA